MKKEAIHFKTFIWIFLLLIGIAQAADFSNFPEMFSKDLTYVIAETADIAKYSLAASNIITPIARIYEGDDLETQSSSESIPNNRNIISLGHPCENSITKQIIGLDDCEVNVGNRLVFAQLFDYGNYVHMVMFGNSAEDVRLASSLFKEYENQNLKDTEICIDVSETAKITSANCLNIQTTTTSSFINPQTIQQQDQSPQIKQTQIKQNQPPPQPACDGCLLKDQCIKVGTQKLTKESGYEVYCSPRNILEKAKEINQPCINDYECKSYYCDKTCKIKESTTSLISLKNKLSSLIKFLIPAVILLAIIGLIYFSTKLIKKKKPKNDKEQNTIKIKINPTKRKDYDVIGQKLEKSMEELHKASKK